MWTTDGARICATSTVVRAPRSGAKATTDVSAGPVSGVLVGVAGAAGGEETAALSGLGDGVGVGVAVGDDGSAGVPVIVSEVSPQPTAEKRRQAKAIREARTRKRRARLSGSSSRKWNGVKTP